MATDFSVFDRIKTKQDYDRANEEFMMRKQLAQAELNKSSQSGFDLDKMGEQVLFKAAMGQPLSQEEQAIGNAYDAKRQSIGFNPVTGAPQINKKAFDALVNNSQLNQYQGQIPNAGVPALPTKIKNMDMSLPGYGDLSETIPTSSQNQFDLKFQEQMSAARGNPKLQQAIEQEYRKAKTEFTEAQAKSAGFADRMTESENILSDKNKIVKGADLTQKALNEIPLVGNFLTESDFKQFNQAERDYINAILRRESGAVISPEEFKNAKQQYIPQAGDDEATIERKRINRENALSGVAVSAGAGYKLPKKSPKYEEAEKEFNNKRPKIINYEDLQ